MRLSPDSTDENEQLMKEPAPHIPTIIDLYGTYQVNRIAAEAQRAKTDGQGIPGRAEQDEFAASQSQDFTPTNTARGRTYISGSCF
ncbi:hypothetical protein M8494_03175 [Serratia ureilytica]